MKETEFSVEVERVSGFDFIVRFKEGMESAMMSEPRPLGSGEHPHAGHMLAAAMGHCMSASLLYCFERSRVEAGPMKTKILTKVERNDEGRLRLTKMRLKLEPEVDNPEKAKRCISIFEEYCIVTQSVREGIDIEVEVIPLSRESD
jgi:uncharacterized OsmC-like protein